jgi:hypothetical protein
MEGEKELKTKTLLAMAMFGQNSTHQLSLSRASLEKF